MPVACPRHAYGLQTRRMEAVHTQDMRRVSKQIWIGDVFEWLQNNYLDAPNMLMRLAMCVMQEMCRWSAPGVRVLCVRPASSKEKRSSRPFHAFDSRHIVLLVKDGDRMCELLFSCNRKSPTCLEVFDLNAVFCLRFLIWLCKQLRHKYDFLPDFDHVVMSTLRAFVLSDLRKRPRMQSWPRSKCVKRRMA